MKTLSLIMSILFVVLSMICGAAILTVAGLNPIASLLIVLGFTVSFHLLEKYSFKFRSFGFGLSFVTVCGKITKNIKKSCTNPVQAGTRDRAVIINWEEIADKVFAADLETLEDLILISGATAFEIDGKNNSIKPKAMMAAQAYANMFDHTVEVIGFDISPEIKTELNSMKDGRFVLVTENYFKGEGGESAFEVYGLTTGLEITVLERDPNDQDTQGAFKITFTTKTNKEPKLPNAFFKTNYATTKAIIDGLL